MSTPHHAASKTSFLDLPTDLSLEVYSYLPQDEVFYITKKKLGRSPSAFTRCRRDTDIFTVDHKYLSPLLQLSRACKTLLDECRDLRLKQAVFSVNVRPSLDKVGP